MSNIKIQGNSSGTGTTTLQTANTSSSTTFTLPGTDGTSGQFLSTDGSGVLTFASGAALNTPVSVIGNATAGAEIRLPEDTDNGSNYVAIKAPDSIASNRIATLPDPAADYTLGYLNIPQNVQTGSYTLVLADAGKHIYRGSGGAETWTIPANGSVAYPIGTALTFINYSATSVSIAITTDTMRLSPAGTTGTRTLAQYGSATAVKVDSTNWIISGSGLT